MQQVLEDSAKKAALAGRAPPVSRELEMLAKILKEKRILVVDDNPVNRKVASATMLKYGAAAVVCVNGGSEAVRKMRPPHLFDCVLMDLQMPVMDGFEATRRIREMEKESNEKNGEVKRVPILALTAYVVKGSRLESMQAGMDEYVTKPLEEEALVAALLNVFTQKEQENASRLQSATSVGGKQENPSLRNWLNRGRM